MAARVFAKQDFPSRFTELKKQLVDSNAEAQARLTAAWEDLLQELSAVTKTFKEKGSDVSQTLFSALLLTYLVC